MKNASTYVKKLNTLLRKIKPSAAIEPPATVDPTTRLVIGFLQWNATARQAEHAFERIMSEVVDTNDLRVTHPTELAEMLGPRYPQVEERAARLRDALQAVYRREHATSLDGLVGQAKKDVKTYLDSLPGMVPYVAGYLQLVGFGGHAVPVDDRLLELLRDEGVVDPEASLDEVVGFLERHVKADDALQTHLALQSWADEAGAGARRAATKPTSRASTAGKTTKRTTQKKQPTKKTTAKSSRGAATTKKKTTKRTTRARR